jgi:hypothetical protein
MNNCYCSVGHISNPENIDILEQMLHHNYNVISKFDYIVVQQNCSDTSEKYIKDYNNVWIKIFGKDVVVLPFLKNRGHTFGAFDVDNAVVNYAKSLPIDFIYKSANDILLGEKLLKYPITKEYDFYYLQGVGYSGLEPFNYDINKFLKEYSSIEYLYPQTNFYIINKNLDSLYDLNELDKAYEYFNSIPNYNGKPWEYIQGFSCEQFLKNAVNRNKFKYKQLISDKTFLELLHIVKDYKMYDCSHKNIYFDEIDVCHFHNVNDPVITI